MEMIMDYQDLIECKIDFQKKVAKYIQDKIDASEYRGYLASGAPRNWWFNKEANDLDFFIQISDEEINGHGSKNSGRNYIFSKIFYDIIGRSNDIDIHDITNTYTQNYHPDIESVITFMVAGCKVQFVIGTKDIKTVVDNFGLSISKILWVDGDYELTPDFLDTLKTKTIKICGIKESQGKKYIDKVLNQFTSFDIIDANGKLITGLDRYFYSANSEAMTSIF